MVRNITISLWWILDNSIRVSGNYNDKIQCVSMNMSWLRHVLPKTSRLQEIEQLERVRVIKNINMDIEVNGYQQLLLGQ